MMLSGFFLATRQLPQGGDRGRATVSWLPVSNLSRQPGDQMKRVPSLLVGLLLLPVAVWAQATARPEILILGTYHMANPGHDIHNMQVDDVLAPQRQQEIAQLLDVLKRFHPTIIAIESDSNGPRPQQYRDYLAGTYTLGRNEIEQIGFRLAKELGLAAIYPV